MKFARAEIIYDTKKDREREPPRSWGPCEVLDGLWNSEPCVSVDGEHFLVPNDCYECHEVRVLIMEDGISIPVELAPAEAATNKRIARRVQATLHCYQT